MRKLIALALILMTVCTGRVLAQGIAMRSNLAADVLGIANLGVDFTLNDQTSATVTIFGGKTYIPLLKKTSALGGQLEWRHWFSHQPYEDFFLGFQMAPTIYSMTRKGTDRKAIAIPLHGIQSPSYIYGAAEADIEHKGFAVPLGFNFGYSWPINRYLNVEVSYGAGILAYSEFDGKEERDNNNDFVYHGNIFGKRINKNYFIDFSTTNICVAVTYILK